VSSYASNTTGYGSNITVTSTEGLFVGMPIRGTGITSGSIITDIIGDNITIYPNITTLGATITCVPQLNYNDTLYVRNGFTHGGVNLYYDPVVKEDKLVPSFSEIPQEIRTTGTVFDGDGTKFYDYRVNYVIPGQGEQAVRFPRLNVFD
jgi:hypothetical protein